MVIAPQTDIIILKVPLTLDNKNQITFSNKEAQYNYFYNLPKLEYENCTYQRKDDVIRFEGNFEQLISYNYCMYKNKAYGNKWFYAFIVGMKYKGNSTTYIKIKTDVYQTWQFDLVFKSSFVEREMINVSEDIPGNNLLPEGLETGEYKIGGTAEIDGLEPAYIVAYGSKEDFGYKYNGIYSGILFYAFTDSDQLRAWITNLAVFNPERIEWIMSIFTVPKLAFYPVEQYSHPIDNDFKATPRPVNLVSTPTNLDGYVPKNQKLRTYPYMYIGFNPSRWYW